MQETPQVLKSLYTLREKRFRFYGEEDEEVEVVDGGVSKYTWRRIYIWLTRFGNDHKMAKSTKNTHAFGANEILC